MLASAKYVVIMVLRVTKQPTKTSENIMTTFNHAQKVKFNNEIFLFDKVSRRGGKGEYAFIQAYPVTQVKMKQVKISELEAM